MYKLYFNLKTNEDLKFYIEKRPSVPSAEKTFSEIEIKGHDGKLYKEDNLQDIGFTIECNFISKNADVWQEQYRKIKRWVNNIKDNRLSFSDDKGYYYKVCKANIDSLSRIYKKLGKFNIKFTVEPYQYIVNNQEILLAGTMYNNWDVCQPIYRIVGNGICTLNVNGNIVNCTVTGQLTIDTQFDKIIEADGSYAIEKTDIKRMQDLYLQEEENNFSWGNGFTVYIIPNWRTI